MPIDKQAIQQAAGRVQDPELHRDLATLQLVQGVKYCDGHAEITLRPTSADPQMRARLKRDVEQAVLALGDEVKRVAVAFDDPSPNRPADKPQAAAAAAPAQPPGQPERPDNPLPNVARILAVGAGKGGVGKSTVSVNLAIGLALAGQRVGLLDGDIYGPSMPTMLGLDTLEPRAHGNTIIPFDVHGIKAVSLGSLVEPDKPLIWRGPMAHGAFRQLATQTDWGDLDYLIIDLPPGTGDVPLTMSQLLPLTGAVVVCTPQKVAQDDAIRALNMFRQLGVEVLGVVENMSYFVGDDKVEYDIFGRGGAEKLAQDAGVPFLGAVPITMALRHNADAGDPSANFAGDDTLRDELTRVVQRVHQQVTALEMSGAFDAPTISVR
ncbi:MAG: Mrp/NBP35 family ATP-binding protein [Planctomycetota bacterium]